MREAPALDQKERDHQAADAAVAVEERVDRFEVLVHDRALHEVGKGVVDMQVLFPGGEHFGEFFDRRRHIGRGGRRAAGRTDPVLRTTKFAGRGVLAACALHEFPVDLADQSQ